MVLFLKKLHDGPIKDFLGLEISFQVSFSPYLLSLEIRKVFFCVQSFYFFQVFHELVSVAVELLVELFSELPGGVDLFEEPISLFHKEPISTMRFLSAFTWLQIDYFLDKGGKTRTKKDTTVLSNGFAFEAICTLLNLMNLILPLSQNWLFFLLNDSVYPIRLEPTFQAMMVHEHF